jgi:hypothetical protein
MATEMKEGINIMKRIAHPSPRFALLFLGLTTLLLTTNSMAQDKPADVATTATNVKTATSVQPDNSAAAAIAKGPSVVRIGVVNPMMRMVETSQSTNTSDAIRTVLIQYLSGPRVEIVPLESRIPVHVEPEASAKNCDYVLYSEIMLRKSGGTSRLGGTLKKLAPAAALIALKGGSTKNMISTATRVAMEVLGEVTVDVKKKDEITFEYRLVTIGGALPLVKDLYKDKAKEDSEDVLTPMIVKTAESVIIAALRGYNVQLASRKAAEQAAPPLQESKQVAQAKPSEQTAP